MTLYPLFTLEQCCMEIAVQSETKTATSPEFISKVISQVLLISLLKFLSNYLSILSSETLIERPKATFLGYNCKRQDWSF